MFYASISAKRHIHKDSRDHSQGTRQSLPMIRYWQRLNERKTKVAHRDIDASEILTCHRIGLDGQSHYAHKDVIAEEAVPIPDPFQLWIGIKQSTFNDHIETSLHNKASRM